MIEEKIRYKKLKRFFKDIENVCKKHGYSISHEDEHGAFVIERYSDYNIDWLKDAFLKIKPKEDEKFNN